MNSLKLICIFVGLNLLGLQACDSDRQRQCEWYLVPEPDHRHLVEDGSVSLCARNYKTKKQRCYFRAPIKFAEDIYGKKIRLSNLEFEKKPIPRKILSVQTCTPDS